MSTFMKLQLLSREKYKGEIQISMHQTLILKQPYVYPKQWIQNWPKMGQASTLQIKSHKISHLKS